MSQAEDISLGSAARRHRRLKRQLVRDLRPVRRLRRPLPRAALWLGAILAVAIALASVADVAAMSLHLLAAPDMWLATLGSSATAALAVLAAFELSLPDRSRLWMALPAPGLLLWIGASGAGCARAWPLPGAGAAPWGGMGHCLPFIIGLSVPLSLLTAAMLRQGYSLAPGAAGAMAGLAVAAAAATLLAFFHPYDATLADLVVHAAAVALVVTANRILCLRRTVDPRS